MGPAVRYEGPTAERGAVIIALTVSVTRVRWRDLPTLLAFIPRHRRFASTIAQAPGYRAGWLLLDGWRTFWSVSVWQSAPFRGVVESLDDTLLTLRATCDEMTHVEYQTARLPSEVEVSARLLREGNFGGVAWPSRAQLRGIIPRPWFCWSWELRPAH